MRFLLFLLFTFFSGACFCQTQFSGYFDFSWNEDNGKIHLEIPADKLDVEFLYVNSLSSGIGSNDIGLDRGQLGNERVVKFVKTGNKILLIQPNLDYRAISNNPKEINAVNEAFAQSVLWGFTFEKKDDNIQIDLTPFLMQDAHQVTNRLKDKSQGSYKVDLSRSSVWMDRTKNFPNNSEFDALLTFTGNPTGDLIKSVTPTPNSVTVHQHHSFIKLPDSDYKPRVFHPYSGYFTMSYYDYATPIESNIEKIFITRHRLEKKNPDATTSDPVEPIVYYIDAGCPEPVKSALMDGARWWDQAFTEAGYSKGTFQVKELPEGADPMDVRYNMIQWVHRSTRGWSYGASVSDPRTGEIIKGHVSLGSLRVRQDFMIANGILSPYTDNDNNHNEMLELALERLRQLAAHEVGHTIGLAHNFAASVNDRASVMDYPHPVIAYNERNRTLNKAYDDKIGAWDKRTILYGYQDFPSDQDEAQGLVDIIEETQKMGLVYISDSDARPTGGAHPQGHLWDNGTDAAQELDRMMDVRQDAMSRFGENTITTGTPLSALENIFVPLYLMHRYQVEAAAKTIGGVHYNYNVKGDNLDHEIKYVDAAQQKKTLASILSTLSPDQLKVPTHILKLIPPPAMGHGRDRESFKHKTGLTFDPMAAAEGYINHVVGLLLHPHRLTRIHQANTIHEHEITLDGYLSDIHSSMAPAGDAYAKELSHLKNHIFIQNLLQAKFDKSTDTGVSAAILSFIQKTKTT